MAVAIRLRRGGRTHAPFYRVVVVDSRTRRDGRVLDEIGVYHPAARPEPREEIDTRKALEWLYKGAQPSDTCRNLFQRKGILEQYDKGVKPEDVPEPEKEAAPEAGAEQETAPSAEAAAEPSEAPAEAAAPAPASTEE